MTKSFSVSHEEARAYAADCRAMAEKTPDTADRLMLLTMAEAWERLAAQSNRP